MKEHLRYLTNRDRKILEFIALYRIGTVDLLATACFHGTSHENVTRVLRRLEGRGLIRKIDAALSFSYFVLAPKGYEALGMEARTPRPLTEQTLPVLLAVAQYCVKNNLCRMTSREFTTTFPELCRPGMNSSNYVVISDGGKNKLQILVVDRGGAAHRIKSRVGRIIGQRKGIPDFSSLMMAGRFRITVLTGTEEQQAKIERRVSRAKFSPVEVTSYVIPELAELLMLRKK